MALNLSNLHVLLVFFVSGLVYQSYVPTEIYSSGAMVTFLLHHTIYYRSVTHRGGWKNVMAHLIEKGTVMERTEHFTPGHNMLLLDLTERHFLWENLGVINQPWLGITHMVMDAPEHFEAPVHLENVLNHPDFLKSLKFCKGIVCFSKNAARNVQEFLDSKLPEVPKIHVCALHHPITTEGVEPFMSDVDLEVLVQNRSAGVLFLGQQYRRLATIHQLKTSRKKLWLPGYKLNTTEFDILKEKVEKELGIAKCESDPSVEVIYSHSFSDYARLLKQNIVIVDLWAATANNAILEAIGLQIPMLIRRIDSTEEYLGNSYPLFFDTTEELAILLVDLSELGKKLRLAHNYMKDMNLNGLTMESFRRDLIGCADKNLN